MKRKLLFLFSANHESSKHKLKMWETHSWHLDTTLGEDTESHRIAFNRFKCRRWLAKCGGLTCFLLGQHGWVGGCGEVGEQDSCKGIQTTNKPNNKQKPNNKLKGYVYIQPPPSSRISACSEPPLQPRVSLFCSEVCVTSQVLYLVCLQELHR